MYRDNLESGAEMRHPCLEVNFGSLFLLRDSLGTTPTFSFLVFLVISIMESSFLFDGTGFECSE